MMRLKLFPVLALAACATLFSGCVTDEVDPAVEKVKIYDVSVLDHPPTPRVQAPPVYPADLKKAGKEGTAVVSFVVTEEGNVTNVKIVSASDPAFGDAAADAVSRWFFRPGTLGKEPVSCRMVVPMDFSLDH